MPRARGSASSLHQRCDNLDQLASTYLGSSGRAGDYMLLRPCTPLPLLNFDATPTTPSTPTRICPPASPPRLLLRFSSNQSLTTLSMADYRVPVASTSRSYVTVMISYSGSSRKERLYPMMRPFKSLKWSIISYFLFGPSCLNS